MALAIANHIVARTADVLAHPYRAALGDAHVLVDKREEVPSLVDEVARDLGLQQRDDTSLAVQRRRARFNNQLLPKRDENNVIIDMFRHHYANNEWELQDKLNQLHSSDKVKRAVKKQLNWDNGSIGYVYAKHANGSLTRLTDASNIFVVQGGLDTSNGDPLKVKIVTQDNVAVGNRVFWLINLTGNFCSNPKNKNNCYVTLGDGYNAPPYSLVPYDASKNKNKPPQAMWTIGQYDGYLGGHWKHQYPLQFTQNNNNFGNGDIDAYLPKAKVAKNYEKVQLVVLKS